MFLESLYGATSRKELELSTEVGKIAIIFNKGEKVMRNKIVKSNNEYQAYDNHYLDKDDSGYITPAIVCVVFSIILFFVFINYAYLFQDTISRRFFLGNFGGGIMVILFSNFVLNTRPKIYREYNSLLAVIMLKINSLMGIILFLVGLIGMINSKTGIKLYLLLST